jgi:hypothetical protein
MYEEKFDDKVIDVIQNDGVSTYKENLIDFECNLDNMNQSNKLTVLSTLEMKELFSNSDNQSSEDVPDIFNFELDIEKRINAISILDDEVIEDVISKLSTIFRFSPLFSLQSYLSDICTFSKINIKLKLDICHTLINNARNLENVYELFQNTINNNYVEFKQDCSIAEQIFHLIILFKYSETFHNYVFNELKLIITDQSINELSRVKIIQQLYKQLNNITIWLKLVKETIPHLSIRVQLLLFKFVLSLDIDKDYKEETEKEIISVCINDSFDENCRADACDIILNMGSSKNIYFVENIIKELGGSHVFHKNSQNIHSKQIEKSALEILQTVEKVITNNNYEIKSFKYYFDLIMKKTDNEIIEKALTIIDLDKTKFKNSVYDLKTLFIFCCTYIENSEYQDVLYERLIEELHEMYGTCTTGNEIRLANVFSGFDGMSVTISYEEQISMYIAKEINKLVTEEKNCDDILISMIETEFDGKKIFLDFFVTVISKIRDRVWNEFKEYIDDTDFDLYFKKNIINYTII